METVNEPETGEVSKDAVTVKQEKNNEYCLQDIDDKLSESAEDDDDDDTNDEDNDEDSNPKKNTQAPLELMAEVRKLSIHWALC
uniref:Glutamate rich 2 n=1 Tax=Macaca fascicularis TaxID=9541 RepID=A0A7N9DA49_MACFA